MTKCRSDWKEVLRDFLSPEDAATFVKDLRAAGFIIIEKGAIGRAQREAVAAYKEDESQQSGRAFARPKIGENAYFA